MRFSFTFGFFFVLALVCSSGNILAVYSLVFCVIHELAHLFAMRNFGADINEVSFYGAGIKISSSGVSELSCCKQIVVYSAGCAVNLAMAVIYIIIQSTELCAVNLCLALMNLLPISYLDGGKILETVFPQHESILKILSGITTILVIGLFLIFAFCVRAVNLTSLITTAFVFLLSLILG